MLNDKYVANITDMHIKRIKLSSSLSKVEMSEWSNNSWKMYMQQNEYISLHLSPHSK